MLTVGLEVRLLSRGQWSHVTHRIHDLWWHGRRFGSAVELWLIQQQAFLVIRWRWGRLRLWLGLRLDVGGGGEGEHTLRAAAESSAGFF